MELFYQYWHNFRFATYILPQNCSTLMFKRLAIPALLASSLLISACQKDNDPQPQANLPETEVKLQRITTYLSTNRYDNEQGYSEKTLQNTAALYADKLQLDFDATEGKDAISFTIPRASLTTGLIGTYELRSSINPEASATSAYTFYRSRAVGFINSATYRDIQGQLTITAYDAQRKLLTGKYKGRLENIVDPADSNTSSGDALRCNVEITGSFTNLKVE